MTQGITAVQAAEHAGLSQYHLSRLFKSLTGKSVMDALTDQWIEAARLRLMTSRQIAALLRFREQRRMTCACRKRTGAARRPYREETDAARIPCRTIPAGRRS